MRKIFLTLISTIALTACSGINTQQFQKIDTNNKTVLISVGSRGLFPILKNVLRQEGFRLYVKSKDKDWVYAKNGLAKYELVVDAQREDTCITGGSMYQFDLSLIDLDSGTEAFTLSGRHCEPAIIDRFREMITNTYDADKYKPYDPEEDRFIAKPVSF